MPQETGPDERPTWAAGLADDGLRDVLGEAFRLLARGVADRRSAFHTPTLATVDLDGRPRLRTVVLRAFDARGPELRVHTDARSAKVAEIAAMPMVGLHAYDPGGRIQVRIDARATLHHGDAIARDARIASRAMSRVCYGTEPAPGSLIPAADAFVLPKSPDEVEAGAVHFVVVACRLTALEWLDLAHTGHRRASFAFAQDGAVAGRWLAP